MSNAGTDQTPDFPDWKGDFENSVQKEKEVYIREHRLTVWRDHDHMHTHQPDSIFTGVIKYLGWESYFNTEISGMMPFFYVFDIPECTVSELGEELKEKIGMNGVRIVGNPEDKMKRVAIVAHLYPNSAMVDEIKEDGYYHSYDMEIMKYMETENIDAIIPGEMRFEEADGTKHILAVSSGFVEMINNRVKLFCLTAESPEEIDIRRAQEAKERAEEQMRQKQSIQEYHMNQLALSRAMARLRVTSHKEI